VLLAPSWDKARHDLALALAFGGEETAALEEVNQAIRLSPRNADYHYMRGHLLERGREREAALEAYDRAIELDPNHYKGRAYRGMMRQRLGMRAGAIEDLELALTLAPPDWPTRGKLEVALAAARKR
jgi:tetratricopeptide (TPR) repeat protein